jgi:hypothetical protein
MANRAKWWFDGRLTCHRSGSSEPDDPLLRGARWRASEVDDDVVLRGALSAGCAARRGLARPGSDGPPNSGVLRALRCGLPPTGVCSLGGHCRPSRPVAAIAGPAGEGGASLNCVASNLEVTDAGLGTVPASKAVCASASEGAGPGLAPSGCASAVAGRARCGGADCCASEAPPGSETPRVIALAVRRPPALRPRPTGRAVIGAGARCSGAAMLTDRGTGAAVVSTRMAWGLSF